ncbi:DUF6350 family protein [Microbacterium yannicii]|uniref:cell division protein PerM n=1 Tax=Microbacterium yannicii TaxID=671622 RepID=UPI0003170D1B|nr:DUF6350 family protein [Microbacterium yannicii]
MNRLIVALLAAVDAILAVAVGLAATLAPLTLLWVFGFGGAADWGAIWPAGVALWQLGNLVPLTVALPPEYLAATGIDGTAASFVLSLAPLAFAAFTVIFAARSGVRASRAEAWVTGVSSAALVFAALTAGAALTAQNSVARAETWQAILIPVLLFTVPAALAAVVTEWSEAGAGAVARLRDRIEAAPHGWGDVPAVVARGTAVVVTGLVALGAAVVAVAVFVRAGHVVALFQAGNVDAIGATVLTLAQLAYLPTLVVWGLSFAAGPGFAVGAGTSVSPAATQVGVVPGLPILGAVPESTTPWLLLLALLPVALGAFAGWIARSRLLGHASRFDAPRSAPRMPQPRDANRTPVSAAAAAGFDATRTAALEGLLATRATTESPTRSSEPVQLDAIDRGADAGEDPIAPRLVAATGIAVLAAAAAGLLALAASGSIGPGRLSAVGPDAGPVALAIGLEVFVGAAILLVSPRGRARPPASSDPWTDDDSGTEPIDLTR